MQKLDETMKAVKISWVDKYSVRLMAVVMGD